MLILLAFICFLGGTNAVRYDLISGEPVTKNQLRNYRAKDNVEYCTVNIEPCDPYEWKRMDGSCNNFEYPSVGTHSTPTFRLLPYDFSPDYEPRKAESGCELPLARRLRTEILQVGKATDLDLTQLVSFYVLFMFGDIMSVHDVINYARNITTCCKPEGKKDYRCKVNAPVMDKEPVMDKK